MEIVMNSGNLFRTTLVVTLLAVPSLATAATAGTSARALRAPTADEQRSIEYAIDADEVKPLQGLVAAGVIVTSHRIENSSLLEKSFSTLLSAARCGSNAVAQFLLEHGAAVDEVDKYGDTALHKAAYFAHAACVKLLLDYRASIDAVNSNGSTPLHKAAERLRYATGGVLSTDAVDILIKAGAALDICDADGNTALMKAACSCNIPTVSKLLAAGANPFVVNTLGNTMATMLAKNGLSPDQISELFKGPAWQRRKDAIVAWQLRQDWVTNFETHTPAAAGGAGASAAPTGGAGIPSAPVD